MTKLGEDLNAPGLFGDCRHTYEYYLIHANLREKLNFAYIEVFNLILIKVWYD